MTPAASGLPSANSSTANDLIPQHYTIDHCARMNAHIKGKISERPTAACTNKLEDEIKADGDLLFYP